MASKSFIKKKHTNKNNAFWCAPRKVKSTTDVIKLDSLLTLNKKPKKKRCRKVRKHVKKVRRIEILAKPKSAKHRPEYNKMTEVFPTKLADLISPRKISKPNKLKTMKNIPENFIIKSRKKNSPRIMLPKKIGLRLFSLVTKRLKELTNSKSV
ncbi:uncharacterized protein LOC117604834 [Osmia lignaria lignaria]|uniref:uncharacterized protein LOC117604834 n=1 Tax=Osmia lignaria lignaria TaxID=1437193 RepID=UPI0014796943|nr:uncharacterized protein LOC117604834 [Osmia lignaria]